MTYKKLPNGDIKFYCRQIWINQDSGIKEETIITRLMSTVEEVSECFIEWEAEEDVYSILLNTGSFITVTSTFKEVDEIWTKYLSQNRLDFKLN